MSKMIIVVLSFFSFGAFATDLLLDKGVTLLAVNGEGVVFESKVDLVNGDNQLVLQLDRGLRSGGIKEQVTSPPYIVVISASKTPQNLEIVLRSTQLNKVNEWVKNGEPIFNIKVDGLALEYESVVLPPASGYFPYSDIVSLVKQYNTEHGVFYDTGKIRNLKQELSSVQSLEKPMNEMLSDQESEASLQLKIWFNRANINEREAHLEWVKQQLVDL
ncbi:DUF2057 family protein [Vibrio sp. LaRot3]|uniref:DUF2057 family protein n=1 Tax=Vibrio sp. LaRot3 TaxID=2998829 RepID=UPI0022CE0C34|nr:DUF2057 family protein [Vibrio sp. LaRot3]MDA0148202.1 DUF2057 family protein [Vibrio sp. LaRot3]